MSEPSLAPGTYELPNNCRAIVRGGKVYVSVKSSYMSTPRCRDCAHYVFGYSKYGQVTTNAVCELRPKPDSRSINPELIGHPRYYSVRPYAPVCEKFMPRAAAKPTKNK